MRLPFSLPPEIMNTYDPIEDEHPRTYRPPLEDSQDANPIAVPGLPQYGGPPIDQQARLPLNGMNTGGLLQLVQGGQPTGDLRFAAPIQLAPAEEAQFQQWIRALPWFQQFVKKFGEEPNLGPDADYNYRAAWKGGVVPGDDPEGDDMQHWPSALPSGDLLKSKSHPTLHKELEMRRAQQGPDKTMLDRLARWLMEHTQQ